VGLVGLGRVDGEKLEHRVVLWEVDVAPQTRGLGIARASLKECLARAALVPGLEQIHLGVVTTNTAACALYKSFGFKTYGEDPAVLKIGDKRYDENLMVRFLDEPG